MYQQVIYLSCARELFAPEELVRILEKSRANNDRLRITGLLLYHEGSIIQVLEGERESVHRLYRKISKDKRHSGIILLMDTPIEKRDFPDWSMGFRQIAAGDLSKLRGYFNLDNHSQINRLRPAISAEVITLINSFASVNINRHGPARTGIV